MKPISDSFSLVVNGAWNPSIFTPPWILANLAEDANSEVSVAFPLEDPTAPRKISLEGIQMFPGRKQLRLIPESPSLEGMKECARYVVKILSRLSHTPIVNCGMNFGFEEESNLNAIYDVLALSDSQGIQSKGYQIRNSMITRAYELDMDDVLNFSLSDNNASGQLSFNFHSEKINDVNGYVSLFSGSYLEDRYSKVIDFCKSVYNLELEED